MIFRCISARAFFATAVLAAGGTFAPKAFADGVTTSVEAGVSYLSLPQNQFFAHRGEGAPFARLNNLETGEDANFGNNVRLSSDYELVEPIGGMASLGLRGSWEQLATNEARSFYDAGAGQRYGWVVLDNSNGFGTANTDTLRTDIDRDFKFFGVNLVAGAPVGTFNDFSLKALVGPSYKRLNEKTRAFGGMVNAAGTLVSSTTLYETINTDYTGASLGLAAKGRIAPSWTLGLEGLLSLYKAKAHYRGSYSDSAGRSAVSQLNRKFKAQGANLAVDLRYQIASNISVGMSVKGEYLSEMPQMNYGSVPTDTASGVLRIEGGRLLGGTGNIKLSVDF